MLQCPVQGGLELCFPESIENAAGLSFQRWEDKAPRSLQHLVLQRYQNQAVLDETRVGMQRLQKLDLPRSIAPVVSWSDSGCGSRPFDWQQLSRPWLSASLADRCMAFLSICILRKEHRPYSEISSLRMPSKPEHLFAEARGR